MAAQPIYPDELSLAMDRLFARMTTFVNSQTDAVMTQMRIDRQETKAEISQLRQESNERFLKIESSQTQFRQEANERFSKLESSQVQLIENQNILMSTFQTTTQAIVKQMQDNHAESMEAINDVKVRVTKLEERDK